MDTKKASVYRGFFDCNGGESVGLSPVWVEALPVDIWCYGRVGLSQLDTQNTLNIQV